MGVYELILHFELLGKAVPLLAQATRRDTDCPAIRELREPVRSTRGRGRHRTMLLMPLPDHHWLCRRPRCEHVKTASAGRYTHTAVFMLLFTKPSVNTRSWPANTTATRSYTNCCLTIIESLAFLQ